jgi:hypothetical protein
LKREEGTKKKASEKEAEKKAEKATKAKRRGVSDLHEVNTK